LDTGTKPEIITPFDPLKTIEAKVSHSIFDVAIEAAIKAAIVYVPVLGAPIIKQLFTFCVEKFASLLYTQTELAVSFIVVDLKVNKQSEEYRAAVSELSTAIVEQKSPEEIERAREEFKTRLRTLINLGSAPK